jgi:phage shock protein PspC (stress-responsive transcriptional regulator)
MTDAPHTSQHQPHTSNGGAGHDGREQLERFFDWIRSSGVRRGDDRWLAGVCGAIAGRTGLDPKIVRGVAIVIAILGGPALFAYAVGWAFLPDSAGRIHAEQLIRGVFDPAMVAIIALFVFTFVPITRGLWWEGAPLGWGMPDWLQTTLAVGWSIAVAIGVVWLVVFLLRRQSAQSSGYESGYRGYGAGGYGASGYGGYGADYAAGTANSAGTASSVSPASFASTAAGATDAASGVDDAATASVDANSADAPTLPFPPAAPASGTTAAPSDPLGAQYGGSWQEQNRAWREQRRAWQAAQRQWHHHRHPGAGFTAIVLGIALAAGAVTAAVVSAGVWSPGALVVGIAFLLGVLALGIIASGIRGRDSGAMGGFAFLAAVALLVLGVFPAGTQFVPFGAPSWTVDSAADDNTPGYAVIAGQPTIDLTSLGDGSGSSLRTIDVWLGFGQTELILPTDRTVQVETNAVIGGVDYGDNSTADRGGMFFHGSRIIDGSSTHPNARVRVWSLVGQVEIVSNNR